MATLLETDYVAETKRDSGHFRMSFAEGTSNHVATGFLIEPDRYNEGKFTVTIELDADSYRGGSVKLRETCEALIEHSQIDGLALNKSKHNNADTITLKTAQPEQLTKILQALSRNLDVEGGAKVYGIVKPDLISAVADELSLAMNGKEYGFEGEEKQSVPYFEGRDTHDIATITSSCEDREYLVVKSNIAGATIEQISSDSHLAMNDSGDSIHAEFTRIDVASHGVDVVSDVLRKAGLDNDLHGDHLNISAPVQDVSKALIDAGLIPKKLHTEIEDRCATLKGDFASAADIASPKKAAELKAVREADAMLQRVATQEPAVPTN